MFDEEIDRVCLHTLQLGLILVERVSDKEILDKFVNMSESLTILTKKIRREKNENRI